MLKTFLLLLSLVLVANSYAARTGDDTFTIGTNTATETKTLQFGGGGALKHDGSTGHLELTDDTLVTGTATVAGTLTVSGSANVNSLSSSGQVSAVGNLVTNGNVVADGTLSATSTLSVLGLSTTASTAAIGNGTDQDVELLFNRASNDAFIRYDSSQSALIFSNDGAITKKIGSGSGGFSEVNFIGENNPDAEALTNNWTATGSVTFTTTSSAENVFAGDNSFSADFFGLDAAVTTDSASITAGFVNRACEAVLNYKGSTDSLVDLEVLENGSEVVGASKTIALSANYERIVIPFTCPSSVNDSLALRLKQTAAGDPAVIYFDNVYLGGAAGFSDLESIGRTVNFAYAQLAGRTALTTNIPADNTIPQITEGDEILTASITPKKVGNLLVIRVNTMVTEDTNVSNSTVAALFQDGQADAIAAAGNGNDNSALLNGGPLLIDTIVTATSTSEIGFSVRVGKAQGASAASANAFADSSTITDLGDVIYSSIQIIEIGQ